MPLIPKLTCPSLVKHRKRRSHFTKVVNAPAYLQQCFALICPRGVPYYQSRAKYTAIYHNSVTQLLCGALSIAIFLYKNI